MTAEAWIAVVVITVTVGLMLTNRVSVDFAMAGGLVALMVFGVVSVEGALSGFAAPAVFTIGSLFVIAAGLKETGAVEALAKRVLGRPQSIAEAQLRLMAPVALLSGFINNTPIVALYLPIVSDWARKTRLSPSKLFMPLSFAAILGGKLTLIGSSSNVVVMGLYQEYLLSAPSGLSSVNAEGLSSMERFWGIGALGLPTTIVGIVFIIASSKWLLPERKAATSEHVESRKYTVDLMVQPDSPSAGMSIEKAGLRHLPGLYLIEIERNGEIIPAPDPGIHVQVGDRLVFAGILESVMDLRKLRGLTPTTDQVNKVQADTKQRTLVEAVVSHSSSLVGKSVRESRFRTLYNGAIVAVHRNGEQVKGKIGDINLKPGDTLLLETHRGFVDVYRNSDDFYLVSMVENSEPVRHDRAWAALMILVALVAGIALTNLSPAIVAMVCALAMVMTGCANSTLVRNSIHWQVIAVIGCALGIGRALVETGAAREIAGTLLDVSAALSLGPHGTLFAVFLIASLFGQVVTNNGAGVLMFPVAIEAARELSLSPEPFVFTLMLAVGTCFMTPVSYQTNLMIYGPGGYRFEDFGRLGLPLTVLVGILTIVICPLVFPF
jgi:di/tricarboxylate transporter